MRRIVLLLVLVSAVWLVPSAGAVDVIISPGTVAPACMNVTELDGVPAGCFTTLKVSNGTLTNNGDGTATLVITGGGGGLSVVGTPADNHVAVFTGANQVEGTPSLFFDAGYLTVGAPGQLGRLALVGSTSGFINFVPQNASGTWNFNLPITAGTAGQVLTSQGGGSTAMTWSTPSSGGVTDGDKTDITVTGGGTIWTIDTAAVTYAKIQAVSATQRLLGRFSAGSGPVEEGTAAQVKTLLGVTFGDIAGVATAPQIPALNTLTTGLTASRCVETDVTGKLGTAATTCGTGAGGGAPANAPYWTAASDTTLTNEVNLGALASGLLKHTVTGGVSTPAMAVAGTDYASPNAVQTLTQTRLTPRRLTMTNGPTLAINPDTYDTVDVTALAQALAVSIAGSPTPTAGQKLTITIYGVANQALTWDSNFAEEAGVALPTTTIGGSYLTVALQYNLPSAKWAVQSVIPPRPKPCPITSSANQTAINANCPGGKFRMASLAQATLFQNPTGTATDMQTLEIAVTSAAQQALTWDTQFVFTAGLPRPTVTAGGGQEDRFGFERHATNGTWVLIATTQPSPSLVRRTCIIRIGEDGASEPDLADANLGPSLAWCPMPHAATVEEISIEASTGTPAVTPHRRAGGTSTALVTGPLATAAGGGIACTRATGTGTISPISNVTCSTTLQNTTPAANTAVSLGLTSGTVGGAGVKRVTISIYFLLGG